MSFPINPIPPVRMCTHDLDALAHTSCPNWPACTTLDAGLITSAASARLREQVEAQALQDAESRRQDSAARELANWLIGAAVVIVAVAGLWVACSGMSSWLVQP